MAEFKMRNRPKKPQEPRAISEQLGYDLLFSELLLRVELFMENNQLSSTKEVEVCVGDNWDGGYCLCLETEGKTHSLYNKEVIIHKEKLAEYNKWRQDNRVEIEKEKLRLKALIKQRKLEMSVGKAKRNLEEAERKLCNNK